MHTVIHAAITHDIDREQSVSVGGDDLGEDEALVHGGAHGEGIVAREQGEVGEGGGADEGGRGVEVVVECHVALKG